MTIVSPAPEVIEPPKNWATINVTAGRNLANGSGAGRSFTLNLTPDRDGGLAPAAPGIHGLAEGPAATWTHRADVADAAIASAAPELAMVAGFLIDTSHRLVPVFTVARMIGCFFLARHAPASLGAVTVSLKGSDGTWAMARVNRSKITDEETVFGRAVILHEDTALGLYILEIAPGMTIPAHAHKIMRERELILDDGLLQQARPVKRGSAFDWPLGHVHAYANPTAERRRVLCVDAPKFMPRDEVALDDPPDLEPIAPFGDYTA